MNPHRSPRSGFRSSATSNVHRLAVRHNVFAGLLAVSALTCGVVAYCTAARAETPSSKGLAGALVPPKTEAETRLLEAVKILASDEFEGRGVGTQGLVKAGEYVRDEFQKAGLDVSRVEKGPFQSFSMITGSELTSPNTLQFTLPDGKTVDLELGKDFSVCSFGGAGEFTGDVVFAGYGIEEKHAEFDEFAGLDLKGKTVVMMRRTPMQSDPKNPFAAGHGNMSRHADLRTKVANAVNRGAAAILFVNDPFSSRESAKKRKAEADKKAAAAGGVAPAAENDSKLETTPEDDVLMKFGYGGRGNEQSLPIMHVTQAALDKVLEASLKTTLTGLETAIDKDEKPHSAVLPGVKVKGQTSLKRVSADIRNVIGVIEGEGPLADETIVIGAHYDHVGRGGEGSLAPGSKEIHNGADDNASGTSALIELARRFGARKEKLPRRLVFIAFTGEELGLIGSARYVKEPIFPLDKTVAMFNMDMVGRLKNDKLIVYGTGTSSRWPKMLEETGKTGNFKMSYKPEGFGPSDHSSFYAKKIPVLHFFTDNHADYHRPGDDWEKINAEGMSRVVDMVETLVTQTAQSTDRPDYIEVKQAAGAQRDGSRPYFGSIPEFGNDAPGYHLSGVAPGSPAELGGLKAGDAIIEVGKNKVTGLDDFDLALRKFKPGDEVDVVVTRKGEKVTLRVKLAAPK